jgi:hypothetical protein
MLIENNINAQVAVAETTITKVQPKQPAMSIEALEAMRTQRPAIPASKYGLEVICGASCETSAQ